MSDFGWSSRFSAAFKSAVLSTHSSACYLNHFLIS
jgi:hypothetical protein